MSQIKIGSPCRVSIIPFLKKSQNQFINWTVDSRQLQYNIVKLTLTLAFTQVSKSWRRLCSSIFFQPRKMLSYETVNILCCWDGVEGGEGGGDFLLKVTCTYSIEQKNLKWEKSMHDILFKSTNRFIQSMGNRYRRKLCFTVKMAS